MELASRVKEMVGNKGVPVTRLVSKALRRAGRWATTTAQSIDSRSPRPTLDLRVFDAINIGCGYDKRPGHLNIDVDPAAKPDFLVIDGDHSAIPHGHYRSVVAKDVLEHIPRTATLEALLEWAAWLRPQGSLYVQTSSILGAADQLRNSKEFALHYGWTLCLFGSQAHPGDFHYTGFTETTLRVYLRAAGFTVESWTMHDGWLFEVNAVKSSEWCPDIRETSDEAFIREAYRHALARDVDPAGLAGGLERLRGGVSRFNYLKQLFGSPERVHTVAKSMGY